MAMDKFGPSRWAALRRIVAFWETDRLAMDFDTAQPNSETPVNPEVFPKVLHHLTDPNSKLTEDQLIKLVTTFIGSCQKWEWETFYRPVLNKTHETLYTLGSFNDVAPQEYQARPFSIQPMMKAGAKAGLAFPLANDQQRVIVMIQKDRVTVTDEGFFSLPDTEYQSAIVDAFAPLIGQDDLPYPLVIECLTDGPGVVMIDMVPMRYVNEFPTLIRRVTVEDTINQFFADSEFVTIGEGVPVTSTTIGEVHDQFDQMGYGKTLLIKEEYDAYLEPMLLVTR